MMCWLVVTLSPWVEAALAMVQLSVHELSSPKISSHIQSLVAFRQKRYAKHRDRPLLFSVALLVSVVSALCGVAWRCSEYWLLHNRIPASPTNVSISLANVVSALRDNGCTLRQRLDRNDGSTTIWNHPVGLFQEWGLHLESVRYRKTEMTVWFRHPVMTVWQSSRAALG